MGQNNLERTAYHWDIDTGSSSAKTKSWENCSAFVTIHFQNGSCLPKPLCGKFPLVPLVLHNENFYCAAASPRLERASLLPGKRKGKGRRPVLAQSTALPTQHSPELHKVCRQNKTLWKYWQNLLLNRTDFSGLWWRAGMLAVSELQAEREEAGLLK